MPDSSNTLVVDTSAGKLRFGTFVTPCVIGRSGACAADAKTEGDGCTPRGRWPVRGVLLRPDRMPHPPAIHLPWRWMNQSDGWSDDPADPAYNRPVRLPHRFGAETMWRDDCLYDVVVVLGHNDTPPVPGEGSAIFFHLWDEATPTEGCIAISREAMKRLLSMLAPGAIMEIC